MSHWRHCKLINKYDTWRVHRVHVLAQLPLESIQCTATSVSLKVCSRVSINLKLWSSWHYRDNCASARSPHAFGHHRPSVTLRVGPGVVPTEVSINVVVVVVVVVYHKHKSQFYEANTWTATRQSETINAEQILEQQWKMFGCSQAHHERWMWLDGGRSLAIQSKWEFAMTANIVLFQRHLWLGRSELTIYSFHIYFRLNHYFGWQTWGGGNFSYSSYAHNAWRT